MKHIILLVVVFVIGSTCLQAKEESEKSSLAGQDQQQPAALTQDKATDSNLPGGDKNSHTSSFSETEKNNAGDSNKVYTKPSIPKPKRWLNQKPPS